MIVNFKDLSTKEVLVTSNIRGMRDKEGDPPVSVTLNHYDLRQLQYYTGAIEGIVTTLKVLNWGKRNEY